MANEKLMRDALDTILALREENAALRSELSKARAGKPSDDLGIAKALQDDDARRQRPDRDVFLGNITKAHSQLRRERGK
jgi:hypothetical protein